MDIGQRIKAVRESKRMTQEELGVACGTTKQTIFKYETGIVTNIPLDRLEQIASALSVSPAYLMGWEDTSDNLPDNIFSLPKMKKIPLVGQIACGLPILAEENIEDYIDLPTHIHADYALTCKGESMVNAGIQDGDVVYIRKQAEVENGQIAAVRVDCEDATLKRFYYDGSAVQLVAENPKFPPQVFAGENINRIKVIGLAVAYTHVIQ